MPAHETRDLKQKALVWMGTGKSDGYGQPLVSSTPQEVRVRWLNKYREVLQPNGTTVAYDVQIITNFYVPDGSVMWLGGFKDIPGTSGSPASDFVYIKATNATSDIKNRHNRYELVGMRMKDKLPNFGV